MDDYTRGFEDIPGTTVFDTTKSRLGYHLNMFCMGLMKAENRAAFKADEHAFLEKFPLTDQQKEAILARDYNRMIELGGNVFFLVKICATDGKPVLVMVASMTGATSDEYAQMMASGGRPIEGNRYTREWKING
jgi:protocatechuate 4,5-dioxygenase alpha chain